MFGQYTHQALTLSTATECICLFRFYIPGTEQTLNKCCLQKLAAHPSPSNFPWSQNLRNPSPRRKHWSRLNSFKQRRRKRKHIHQVFVWSDDTGQKLSLPLLLDCMPSLTSYILGWGQEEEGGGGDHPKASLLALTTREPAVPLERPQPSREGRFLL